MKTKRFLKLFSVVILTFFLVNLFSACITGEKRIEADDIVIVYTTDIHCAIDDNIGYSSLSA